MPFPHRLAAALLLATALPAAAELRNLEIAFDPAVPTWREEVTAVVHGEATAPVEELGLVATLAIDPATQERFIRLRISEPPGFSDPPQFVPFTLRAGIGRLIPGEYSARLFGDGGGPALATGTLTVYREADLEITLPAEPPTDDRPVTVAVTGITESCSAPTPAEITGDAISIEFPDGCPVLPIGVFEQTFEYELGPLPAGEYEIRVFRRPFPTMPEVAKEVLRVHDADLCVPSPTVLCLGGGRFEVSVAWSDFFGGSGAGQAIPLREDTGLFWFFDAENVELTVKLLAACPVDGHHWVFIASGSTVGYTVTVSDRVSGQIRTYDNALGEVPELIADTAAFDCP